MQYAIQLVLWLGAILLGVVLTLALQEPLHRVLARYFIRIIPRAPRRLTGTWSTEYKYAAGGQELIERQLVELRQVGGYVYGHSVTHVRHGHVSKGRFTNELYFTGSWENTTSRNIYHGAFQFILAPDGKSMRGKWIGFSDRLSEVNHGDWAWSLLSRDVGLTAEELKKLAEGQKPALLTTN